MSSTPLLLCGHMRYLVRGEREATERVQRRNDMYGCVLRQLRRGTFAFVPSLCLMVCAVSAQQTAPVTITVQFGSTTSSALGTGGGDLAAATSSAAGTATRLVFDELVIPPA